MSSMIFPKMAFDVGSKCSSSENFEYTFRNSPNSTPRSGHVTLATGRTLRDKCLDNVSCFSVALVKPGLPVTVN